jgi:RND family efflux transporter MFP subunit
MFKRELICILVYFSFSSWIQAAEPVAGQCLFEPSMTVDLGSPVRGVISEVLVDRGDIVKKGETVARIDSRAQIAAVALAKSRAEFSKRKIARNEELIKEDLLSTQEKDEIDTESELALLELEKARTELDLRNIRSPINGVVVKKVHTQGEFIDETEILVLAQIDPINVEVVVPVAYFGQVSEGMQATVTPEAPLDNTYNATIDVVDKVIDAASGTFRVRLQIPNKDLKIPTGLRCDLKFPFE